MSAAPEQRAWRGKRPPSISQTPQSRSQNASPHPSTAPAKAATPTPSTTTTPPPQPNPSKIPQEHTKQSTETSKAKQQNRVATPTAPLPSSTPSAGKTDTTNVWEQRKSAAPAQQQQKPKQEEKSEERRVDNKPSSRKEGKKGEGAGADSGAAPSTQATTEVKHVAVNSFNTAEVIEALSKGSSAATPYKVEVAAAKTGSAGPKATHMANGQHFLSQLGKQLTHAEGKR